MKFKLFAFLFLLTISVTLDAKERHIALLVNSEWVGEVALAYRVQKACQNIQWNADVINLQNSQKLRKTKYDFVINFTPGEYKHPSCKNYMAIFHPTHHYFENDGFLKDEYSHYDGYLLTYSPDLLAKGKKNFAKQHKFPYMQWYPSAHKRKYKQVDPSHLFYIPSPWGDRIAATKFRECLRLLDKESYMRFHGLRIFLPLFFPLKHLLFFSFHDFVLGIIRRSQHGSHQDARAGGSLASRFSCFYNLI